MKIRPTSSSLDSRIQRGWSFFFDVSAFLSSISDFSPPLSQGFRLGRTAAIFNMFYHATGNLDPTPRHCLWFQLLNSFIKKSLPSSSSRRPRLRFTPGIYDVRVRISNLGWPRMHWNGPFWPFVWLLQFHGKSSRESGALGPINHALLHPEPEQTT